MLLHLAPILTYLTVRRDAASSAQGLGNGDSYLVPRMHSAVCTGVCDSCQYGKLHNITNLISIFRRGVPESAGGRHARSIRPDNLFSQPCLAFVVPQVAVFIQEPPECHIAE